MIILLPLSDSTYKKKYILSFTELKCGEKKDEKKHLNLLKDWHINFGFSSNNMSCARYLYY